MTAWPMSNRHGYAIGHPNHYKSEHSFGNWGHRIGYRLNQYFSRVTCRILRCPASTYIPALNYSVSSDRTYLLCKDCKTHFVKIDRCFAGNTETASVPKWVPKWSLAIIERGPSGSKPLLELGPKCLSSSGNS